MNIEEIKPRLKAMIVERLTLDIAPDEIKDDAPLFSHENEGLDLDSVEALEVVVGIEQNFDVTVEEGDYKQEFYSINTLSQFVKGLIDQAQA
ncbi:MAG: phosphopantetheine-binding protein [Candidatus Parabeggiatoa sp.]|nr:phosphopantetheine-binding protein [Candidatus Parabeggiatoa sp.]